MPHRHSEDNRLAGPGKKPPGSRPPKACGNALIQASSMDKVEDERIDKILQAIDGNQFTLSVIRYMTRDDKLDFWLD